MCENAIVMLTVNYSKEKLYNGSTGKVIGFDNKILLLCSMIMLNIQ